MKNKVVLICTVLLAFMVLSACGNEKTKDSPNSSQFTERLITQNWEEVSRAYRIRGHITKSTISEDKKLISLSLDKVKNMVMKNNPVDYDFEGKTIELFIKGEGLDKTIATKLNAGTDIAVAFAQYAIPDEAPAGKVFFGALPEWVYVIQDGQYVDLQGNPTPEDSLQP